MTLTPRQVARDLNEWDFAGQYHLCYIQNPNPVPGTAIAMDIKHIEDQKVQWQPRRP
jgi:hypothetical protein